MRDLTSMEDITVLVRRFYDAVRGDPTLGPIFDVRISDWDEHLDTMRRFWSSIVLGMPLYHGNPVAAHMGLAIGDAHFARWLELWRDVVTASFTGPVAAGMIVRAERIAGALSRHLAEVP